LARKRRGGGLHITHFLSFESGLKRKKKMEVKRGSRKERGKKPHICSLPNTLQIQKGEEKSRKERIPVPATGFFLRAREKGKKREEKERRRHCPGQRPSIW